GKQRGREEGGEHDRGERKPVRYQAADGGGPTSHASVTSTVLAPGERPPGTPGGLRPRSFVTGPGPIPVAACPAAESRHTAVPDHRLPFFQVRMGGHNRSTSAARQ